MMMMMMMSELMMMMMTMMMMMMMMNGEWYAFYFIFKLCNFSFSGCAIFFLLCSCSFSFMIYVFYDALMKSVLRPENWPLKN